MQTWSICNGVMMAIPSRDLSSEKRAVRFVDLSNEIFNFQQDKPTVWHCASTVGHSKVVILIELHQV